MQWVYTIECTQKMYIIIEFEHEFFEMDEIVFVKMIALI